MEKISIFILAILIAFILNIVWEFSHYKLYNDLSGIPATKHLIMASFMDIFIIFCVFLVVSLKNRNLEWIVRPTFFDYLIIIILCLIVAIWIETWALNIGRWTYKDSMPTIFGLGLSPLVQLFITGVLALWIVRFFDKFYFLIS